MWSKSGSGGFDLHRFEQAVPVLLERLKFGLASFRISELRAADCP